MSKILIDENNTCLCDCGTRCVLGRVGSQLRCNKYELEKEGFDCVVLKDINNEKPLSFTEWVERGGYFDNISVKGIEALGDILKTARGNT